MAEVSFTSILYMVQEYISQNYAAALSDRSKLGQLRAYIDKYLHDTGYTVEGLSTEELSEKLYTEMAEYSILTPYLGKDSIEEININGWDDICVTYNSGYMLKLSDHFFSPQHAVDIVKRLLHHSKTPHLFHLCSVCCYRSNHHKAEYL